LQDLESPTVARFTITPDAEISHQRIVELVDEALQASPSTIRRWRRGAVSPTAANLQRLQERVSTSF
jgi:hypothetical protein